MTGVREYDNKYKNLNRFGQLDVMELGKPSRKCIYFGNYDKHLNVFSLKKNIKTKDYYNKA